MLALMYRHVFASLLAVTLATPVFAHDEKDSCDGKHSEAAAATSGAGALKPGVLLVRGEPLPRNQAAQPLSAVLSKPEDGKTVLVEGVVRRACSHMGCWMELVPAEGGAGVRVTFKDYGFFVPTDSAGARARVRGTVKVTTTVSIGQISRVQPTQGEPVLEPSVPEREVTLVATGVELRR